MEAKIVDLHTEILEKIFLMLPSDSIKNLTQVSKKFNDVIGSNKQLMDSFIVMWRKCSQGDDLRPLLTSRRKYRKINIKTVTALKPNNIASALKPSLVIFLSNNATTLKDVTIENSAIKASELQQLLELVRENLETIELTCVKLFIDCDIEPIHLPKLVKLDLEAGFKYGSLLKFFTDTPNLKTFEYTDTNEDDDDGNGYYLMNNEEFSIFAGCLGVMKSLTSLSLNYHISEKLFKSDKFAETASFKLERLHIACYTEDVEQDPARFYRNLKFFLTQQRSSLKYLNLIEATISSDVLQCILQCPLHELSLTDSFLSSYDGEIDLQNSSIQNLLISTFFDHAFEEEEEIMLCQLLKNCVAVKAIYFSRMEVTFEMCCTINEYMYSLETLHLHECKTFPMPITTLKELSIQSNSYIEELIKFIRVNRHLKILQVSKKFPINPSFYHAILKINHDNIKIANF